MNRIDALGLAPNAHSLAVWLAAKYPVTFTSGRRGIAGQAAAMAKNTLADPDYIQRTYRDSPVKHALLHAMADATRPLSRAQLQDVFFSVLSLLPKDELRRLSWHFTGEAFDVLPMPSESWWPDMLVALADECRARGGELLTHEGKLVRVHVELAG